MDIYDQNHVIESYRQSFLKYGNTPEALKWSPEGQRWRFEKLIEMIDHSHSIDSKNKKFLEVGCGLGHLYPLLKSKYGNVDYTGIDIVPELVEHAQSIYPDAKFECRDLIKYPLKEDYDFGFISGVFNAPHRDNSLDFMTALLKNTFAACRVSLVFNFTSSHVNKIDPDTNYFDPIEILTEIFSGISKKASMHHHYKNCDVAILINR